MARVFFSGVRTFLRSSLCCQPTVAMYYLRYTMQEAHRGAAAADAGTEEGFDEEEEEEKVEEEEAEEADDDTAKAKAAGFTKGFQKPLGTPLNTAYARVRTMAPTPKPAAGPHAAKQGAAPPPKAVPAKAMCSKRPMAPAQPAAPPVTSRVMDYFPSVEQPPGAMFLGMAPGVDGKFEQFDEVTATLIDGCVGLVFHPCILRGTVLTSHSEPIWKAENGFTYQKLHNGWYLSCMPIGDSDDAIEEAGKQD